jgi:TPR repeat protein
LANPAPESGGPSTKSKPAPPEIKPSPQTSYQLLGQPGVTKALFFEDPELNSFMTPSYNGVGFARVEALLTLDFELNFLREALSDDAAIKAFLAERALLGGDQDFAEEVARLVEDMALANSARHMGLLGQMYFLGYGRRIDLDKAVDWWEKAVAAGEKTFLFELGSIFVFQGIKEESPKKLTVGLDLWREAAKAADISAAYYLAQYYHIQAKMTKKFDDFAEAFNFYLIAAKGGLGMAKCRLGDFFSLGIGTKVDAKSAFFWYERAANSGIGLATHNVAVCYLVGRGAPKDLDKFQYWLFKSAEMGQAHSQFYLACDFLYGKEGFRLDYVKAVYWLKLAAKTIPQAQYMLGICYSHGLGVKRDLIEATKLLSQFFASSVRPIDG